MPLLRWAQTAISPFRSLSLRALSTSPASGPKVAVAAFVRRRSDGKILLGQRKKVAGDGYWALAGGHVEFGETLEEATVREVREETGLNVQPPTILAVKTALGYLDPNAPTQSETKDSISLERDRRVPHYHFVVVLTEAFCVDNDPQVLNLEPEKCHGWSWVSWEDITCPSSPYRPLFSALAQVASDPSFSLSPHHPKSSSLPQEES
ncbi:MAG: NUDIX hydrolase domain-like protein [Piptocephalis tieghemiana]|nr:MAG: NUDIX hydrolase domain-like protein [Piptocephalis tieghemiana]